MVRKKLTIRYIDESEIPARRLRAQWEEVFSDIPRGKALIVKPDEYHYSTVRLSLKKLQKMGKLKRLYVTTKTVNGERWTYVVNPSE
jgi:hypothetical protein